MVGHVSHRVSPRGRKATPHQFVNGVESKWCGGCREVVELEGFDKATASKPTPDGLQSRCRPCSLDYDRKYRAKKSTRVWPESGTKRCTTCKVEKPLSAFRRNSANTLGRATQCKSCSNANLDVWRERRRPERLAYNRDYYRSARGRAVLAKWRDKNPVKIRAHSLVDDAVLRGVLVKPDRCEWCGSDARLDSHHPDYAKPLEVEWLCRKCHKGWHRQHGEGLNAEAGAQSATG